MAKVWLVTLLALFSLGCFAQDTSVKVQIPLRVVKIDREDGILVLVPTVQTVECTTDEDKDYLECEQTTYNTLFVPKTAQPDNGNELRKADARI